MRLKFRPRKSKSFVGLHIEDDKIFATELTLDNEGVKLCNFGWTDVPPGSMEDGKIKDVSSLAAAIRELSIRKGIKSKAAILGLPGEYVITRLLRLPLVSPEALRGIIVRELKQYKQFEEVPPALDFKVISEGTEEGGVYANVLVVATPQDLVDSYIRMSKAAKLTLLTVDVIKFARLRVLMSSVEDKLTKWADNVFIVLVEKKLTSIYIIKGGELIFSRDVDTGYETVAQRLEGGETLTVAIDELFSQVQNSVVAFQRGSPQEKVSGIILAMDGIQIHNLDKFFEARLGIPVEVVRALSPEDTRLKLLSQEVVQENLDSLAVGVGLGLGDSYSFNLVPPEYAENIRFKRQLSVFSTLSIIVLAAFLFATFILGLQVFISKAGSRRLLKQTQRMEEALKKREKIATRQHKELERLKSLKEFIDKESEGLPWTALLGEMNVLVPRDIWLTQVGTETADTLAIGGIALNSTSVTKLMEALNVSPYFKTANLESIETAKLGNRLVMRFALLCRLAQ